MFNRQKNEKKNFIKNNNTLNIPPPLKTYKTKKPFIMKDMISGIFHGFSFGAGSEIAHQGLKKVFDKGEKNNNESNKNHFQEEVCNQLRDEYKKCILNLDNCKNIEETLKTICSI